MEVLFTINHVSEECMNEVFLVSHIPYLLEPQV